MPSGGQPGHPGSILTPTAAPDHVVDHNRSICAGCGAALTETDRHGTPICRQIFDRSEPQSLETTGHRAHCCLCSTVTGAIFPTGVTAPVRYGPRITAWVRDLLHVRVNSETRLTDLMSNRFAVPIATATIAALSRRTAQRFGDIVDRIWTVAPVRHLEETGVRIDGRSRWLHVLRIPLLTTLRVGAGRGDVDRDVTGILVHDNDANDFIFEDVRHAICNVHHRCELQVPIDIETEDGACSMHRPLERVRRVAHIACETGRSRSILSSKPMIASSTGPSLSTTCSRHSGAASGDEKRRVDRIRVLRLQTHKDGGRGVSPTCERPSRTMRPSVICKW